MAGPTASVLLAQPLTGEQRLWVRSVVAELSSGVEGDHFWVQQRPFILTLGPECDGEFEDDVAEGLPDMIGWAPKDVIGLAAMSNEEVDHRLLGEFCLPFARSLNGVIDFGGELPVRAIHAPGKLFTVPYRAATGHVFRYHVSNADFLDWWLRQPGFSMIK